MLYGYTFEKWKHLSKEQINPLKYLQKNLDDILDGKSQKIITTVADWENKKDTLLQQIQWMLGDQPAIVTNPGPLTMENQGAGEDYFGSFLSRPRETNDMGIMKITPYKGFGDYLYGYLYYPKSKIKKPQAAKLPVIIYLHEFDYSKGFSTIGLQHDIQPFFENLVSQAMPYSLMTCSVLEIVSKKAPVFTKDIRTGQKWEKWFQMYAPQ